MKNNLIHEGISADKTAELYEMLVNIQKRLIEVEKEVKRIGKHHRPIINS
jgi:hypothetical protein